MDATDSGRGAQQDYIHGMPRPPHDARFPGTWKALQELQASGTIRLLGISNFNGAQIEAMARDHDVPPDVLQNKFDPFHQGDQLNRAGQDLVALAASKGIATVGYSTLRGWPLAMSPAEDARVAAVAAKHDRTASQVLLRWALQSG